MLVRELFRKYVLFVILAEHAFVVFLEGESFRSSALKKLTRKRIILVYSFSFFCTPLPPPSLLCLDKRGPWMSNVGMVGYGRGVRVGSQALVENGLHRCVRRDSHVVHMEPICRVVGTWHHVESYRQEAACGSGGYVADGEDLDSCSR